MLFRSISLIENPDKSSSQKADNSLFLLIFSLAPNDRGYGHGRVAGVFTVAQRQSECGRKTR
jgi:hypothetical protein